MHLTRSQIVHGRRSPDRPFRRVLRTLRVVAALALFGASVCVAFCVLTLHLGIRPVLTGSMRPDYGPGAVLLTRRVPVTSVRPGMIVLFVPPGEHSEFAHRVVSVTGPKGAPVITTKGDANKTVDPWHAQLTSSTVNEVVGSLPAIGRLMVALRGSGQIVLALLGGLVAAWAGARWILGASGTRGRRAHAGVA